MFIRPVLFRALIYAGHPCSIRCSSHTLKKVAVQNKNKFNNVTCSSTWCLSSFDGKTPPNVQKSGEQETSEDEDTVEIFDLEKERNKVHGSGQSEYAVFKDEESPVILDVEEERFLSSSTGPVVQHNEFEGISLQRGVYGVFDTEELVNLLKVHNAEDIVVIRMPDNLGYADHMIIISGRSTRHLFSMAEYVRRLFKRKMNTSDRIPIIEGKRTSSKDWLALDLGNIVLHIFSKKTREIYDLESLWTLGHEYDPHLINTEDKLSEIINKHSLYLGNLQPAEPKS